MTAEDRDLLFSLRRQQVDLQESLERLNAQLNALEARTNGTASHLDLPPIPLDLNFPPIPITSDLVFPPIPLAPALASLPPVPPQVVPKPSFEFQFGRWLTRMGALFGVIALALIFALPKVQALIGHVGLLALSAATSIVVIILGERLERKGKAGVFFGRSIIAMALAWLYVTAFASYYYEPIRVVQSPIVAGFLLLLWSLYVLMLAQRKKSQPLALFSITLAYVGTAINPIGAFTMAADLSLAVTAMIFLIRNGWAAVSSFSLIGTYLALLRQLVLDEHGELVLDTSRNLSFWPPAVYLLGAWIIFTTAFILATEPSFRGAKRFFLVGLNNLALIVLLALTAEIAGYGIYAMGWTLLDTGILYLVTSRFAGYAEIEPVDLMGAYAAQGLAVFTAGLILVYSGVSRCVGLLIETFFLGVAAAFSGDRILTISTYVAASFATLFTVWEIAIYAHHPWLLGFGGAVIMLVNAWNCRAEVRYSPLARSTVVLSTSCYCILAIALIFTALYTELSDSTLPPVLALVDLGLTYSIYGFSLYELPPLAQILLVIALILVLFPADTGEQLPGWTTVIVAIITLWMTTWWSRQRITRSGPWMPVLTFGYALALVYLLIEHFQPELSTQDWIVDGSILSVVLLAYGAFMRVWSIALASQLLLVLALVNFFAPPDRTAFPWSLSAALVPLLVLMATARATHEWLRLFGDIPASARVWIRLAAYAYQLLALAGIIHLVFALILPDQQMAIFLFLGTLLLSVSVRYASPFGIRCSFILSAIGVVLFFAHFPAQARAMSTLLNALSMLLFLAQSPLLRQEGKQLVSSLEAWTLLLISVTTTWFFISGWVWYRMAPGYLTMGWALYASFLFLFGLFVQEKRLRSCGMALIIAAILRVIFHDMWGLSSGYRVLTFFVLALITLGLGFIILRRADKRSNEKKAVPSIVPPSPTNLL